jgi:hypothetical protein
MEIGRVVGNDGKLLGFNIGGHLICRDDRMPDDMSMRDLEIHVLAELMTAPLDRSVQAERLIRLDDQRIAELTIDDR